MNPEASGKNRPNRRRLFVATLTSISLLTGPVAMNYAQAATDREEVMPAYVDALLLKMKGDYWGAIEGLRKVMSVLPDEPAVRFSISRSYRRLAVLDSARVYGEAALKLDPENSHYRRYLAGLAHDMRDFDRAAELYGQAAALEPGLAGFLYLQGVELMSANRLEEAIKVFEQAVTIDPYNEKALTQLLRLQISLKRFPQAIDTCQKLLKLNPENQKLRMMLGELYAKDGREELAAVTLKKLTESDPSYVSGWTALFDLYISNGQTADFRREMRALLSSRAVPSEKIDDLLRLFIARSGKQKQYKALAREFLDELIARRPQDSEIFVLQGLFEMIHERQREGQLSFSKAVELDSGNAEAWEALINAHIAMNEKQQAYSLLRKARVALPGEGLRWKLLEGSLLLQTGEPKKAAKVLEQAVRMKMKDGDMPLLIRSHITLALAYDKLGMRNRSRLAYATVLKIDAHNSLAMNNLAYLLAEEGTQLREALLLATNAVLLEPDNGVYLDTLGWVNFKLRKYDRARILLEKAIETGIEEPEVYLHLGEAYRKLGDEPKAKEMFEKAKAASRKAGKEKSGH
ncbi:MAG TPA: tetratricopeptide repeat protein [Chlorobaculum parvum]|uniref:Tetratricopeptide repeat protein n=1 Tax=Chlorobaculum parvum TaxID=274539 RepID=A0A7C5H8C8_9CHLB|nr:tetratricopeptide repeat protein [Chlorobaculum parvum]